MLTITKPNRKKLLTSDRYRELKARANGRLHTKARIVDLVTGPPTPWPAPMFMSEAQRAFYRDGHGPGESALADMAFDRSRAAQLRKHGLVVGHAVPVSFLGVPVRPIDPLADIIGIDTGEAPGDGVALQTPTAEELLDALWPKGSTAGLDEVREGMKRAEASRRRLELQLEAKHVRDRMQAQFYEAMAALPANDAPMTATEIYQRERERKLYGPPEPTPLALGLAARPLLMPGENVPRMSALYQVVSRFSYKPNWKFSVGQSYGFIVFEAAINVVDVVAWRASKASNTIELRVSRSAHPSDLTTEHAVVQQLQKLIEYFEKHEAQEWEAIDGRTLHDPHEHERHAGCR